MQSREKVRVYQLARELDIDTADLLRLCIQTGYDVKNQLSNLDPDQQKNLEELVKKGAKSTGPATPAKPVTKVVSPDEKAVPNLAGPRALKREAEAPRVQPAAEIETPAVAEVAPPPPEVVAPEPVAETPTPMPAQPKPAAPIIRDKVPTLGTRPSATTVKPPSPAPAPPVSAAPTPIAKTEPTAPPVPPKTDAPKPTPPPATLPPIRPAGPGPTRMPQDLSSRPSGPAAKDGGGGAPPARPSGGRTQPRRIMPGGHAHLQPLKPIAPPSLKPSPKPVDKGPKVMQPIVSLTPEHIKQNQTKPIRAEDLLRPQAPVPVEVEDEDDPNKKDKKKAIPGREERQKKRNQRAEIRKSTKTAVVIEGGKIKELDDDDVRPGHRISARIKLKQKPLIKQRPTALVLESPITIRLLSEELGIKAGELIFKLRDHGAQTNLNINSVIDAEMSSLVALDFGCDLKVKEPQTAEAVLLGSYETPDDPADLVLRAPIVTVMGHVDHGKTSLLDRIRRSNVVATEAGGITQVIRAWRVEHGGKPVTFLDTPGHEAFTKMRARGAQVTDVAVIVVAADDGVMPQTEEAISHAKAAGVSLVIAINKIDMPSANVTKTRQQLYGLNVLPDNMGGDTPFVETSAATGKGIDELLDQLAIVAELKELKANPKKPARGTCLEAMLSEGEGVLATLLVRDGTLRQGDVILRAPASGRVRAMYNDLGKPIDEAGPSVPVRITGLDIVPDAGDTFQVLPDLNMASDIADHRRDKQRETIVAKRAPLTLERLTEMKVDELKVILKADFRGSVEAIRKELDKLQHAEVRVRVLEAGIGLITENDVWLALASPEDTMIVGFNVVPDDAPSPFLSEPRRANPRVQHHLQPDERHPRRPGRQAEAARGSGPPGPGNRA